MLTGVEPEAVAADRHPAYRSRAGRSTTPSGRPSSRCSTTTPTSPSTMAEHGVPDGTRVLGVAFDGTGYGDDGAVVGRGVPGRRLPRRYDRAAHLAYVALPGR